MRLATRIAMTLAVLASMAPPAARLATAQLTDVYHDGMIHHPIGSAHVIVDPPSLKLVVSNIGSSGNDGVELTWTKGARGCSVQWPDYDADFATPGCTHTLVLRGAVSGVARLAGKVTVVRNADGSENMVPDFSAVHATGWVQLIDGSGASVSLTCCKPTYDVKMAKKVLAAASRPGSGTLTGGHAWATFSSTSPTDQSIEVVYPVPMLATVNGVTNECRGIRFFRNSGDALSSTGPIGVKGSWPSNGGPGAFSISTELADPPCAGLNCPNGPGTELRALGGALWLTGGTTGPMELNNIGSSGQDGCRESPSLQSTEPTRPPVKKLSIVIVNPNPASALDPGTMLWRAEGKSSGLPDHELCTMSCTMSGGQMHCVPEFSGSAASGYHVMLSLNGAFVADVYDPLDGLTVTTSMPVYEMELALNAAGGPRIIRNCRTPPCPGEPVLMGGALYVADHIEIEGYQATRPSNASILSGEEVSALEFHASGMAPISIIGGSAEPVTPLAGVGELAATVDFGRLVLSPNPALGPVSVRFALPVAGRAQVSVTDVLGRRVRDVADANFAAGMHDLSWDGHNDAGRKVPAGVYFVRLEVGATSRAARLTRLW